MPPNHHSKDPFRHKRNAGEKRPRKQWKRRKGKAGQGGAWALLGIAATFAMGWAFAAFKIKGKRQEDRRLLSSMALRPLMITEHAACRIDCRHIPESEVREALQKGSINARKSDMTAQPCPKVVVDGRVGKHGKNVQGVFSACSGATKVITVIDRDRDWECYCP